MLEQINRENFGIIYEPANLMLNGQGYGVDTLQRLAPHIMNVYVQNHRLDPEGPEELTRFAEAGQVSPSLPWEPVALTLLGISGLHAINYDKHDPSGRVKRYRMRKIM